MAISLRARLRSVLGDTLTEEELLKRFYYGKLLGVGATCKVYAALDAQTNAKVAIKEFDKAQLIEIRRSIAAHGKCLRKELAVHRRMKLRTAFVSFVNALMVPTCLISLQRKEECLKQKRVLSFDSSFQRFDIATSARFIIVT
ncbi:hypothetical protein ABG067_000010 [Albugo candida]